MSQYRNALPQLSGDLFLTDSGLETVLIFHHDIELPDFASFPLLADEASRGILLEYFRRHAAIARTNNVGIILETPTWRASADWGAGLGHDAQSLNALNRMAVELVREVQNEFDSDASPIVVSGNIGPRGDGYAPGDLMTELEAEQFHRPQIHALADANADMISALTMTNTNEAIGVVRAAQSCDIPVCIAFTVETDGKLPTGQSLKDAIGCVDQATNSGPAYYMINCAHPTHFDFVMSSGEPWINRIRGIRANASKLSHAELDEAEDLDDGNPAELGQQLATLRSAMPSLNILGGCCGTDHRHIEAICVSCIDT